MWEEELCEAKGAVEVGVHLLENFGGGYVFNGAEDAVGCVVDEDVDG